MTPRALEVLDGLMLGGAQWVNGALELGIEPRYRPWAQMVAEELHAMRLVPVIRPGHRLRLVAPVTREMEVVLRRWYDGNKTVPRDVQLGSVALAHWFAGAGARVSNGYAVRLWTYTFTSQDVMFLRARLTELYGWEPVLAVDRGRQVLRLSRSGDRLAFRRLVTGLLPPCFAPRLNLRESAPCTPEEAARRRRPVKLTYEDAERIRARAAAGEPYAAIAHDHQVSPQQVGRIARGEAWFDPGASIIRRRRTVRRLTPQEEAEVRARAVKGESQTAIGRALGIGQPRVSRILRRHS
ncbi:putative homing endonuclease [Virus Rctr197k]|nr:putative homing endonuclease [Virus Rctr197k]